SSEDTLFSGKYLPVLTICTDLSISLSLSIPNFFHERHPKATALGRGLLIVRQITKNEFDCPWTFTLSTQPQQWCHRRASRRIPNPSLPVISSFHVTINKKVFLFKIQKKISKKQLTPKPTAIASNKKSPPRAPPDLARPHSAVRSESPPSQRAEKSRASGGRCGTPSAALQSFGQSLGKGEQEIDPFPNLRIPHRLQ